MGEVVRDLVALGVVEMVPDPDDGRAKLVRYTEAGRAQARQGYGTSARSRRASSRPRRGLRGRPAGPPTGHRDPADGPGSWTRSLPGRHCCRRADRGVPPVTTSTACSLPSTRPCSAPSSSSATTLSRRRTSRRRPSSSVTPLGQGEPLRAPRRLGAPGGHSHAGQGDAARAATSRGRGRVRAAGDARARRRRRAPSGPRAAAAPADRRGPVLLRGPPARRGRRAARLLPVHRRRPRAPRAPSSAGCSRR